MSDHNFFIKYDEILEKINQINPIQYAKTRNFLDGNVSRLSPYFTHGVISLRQVADVVLGKYGFLKSEKFLMELAWREYYLRVWENKGDAIFENLLVDSAQNYWDKIQFKTGIPEVLETAQTGIVALDQEINNLKNIGYMHNHARMWLAGTVTNIAHYNWVDSAKWLYYYLLDGDLASNTLSWQWVAGTCRNRVYFANQENVNKYSGTTQLNTFLDKTYEELEKSETPENFLKLEEFDLKTNLNLFAGIKVSELNLTTKEVLLFHPWMLNNKWKEGSEMSKILLVEPSVFQKNPVSDLRIKFILEMAKQIQNLQIVVGEVAELPKDKKYFSITNPIISQWKSLESDIVLEEPEYLFPEVSGYFANFFGYYKSCLKKSTWLGETGG